MAGAAPFLLFESPMEFTIFEICLKIQNKRYEFMNGTLLLQSIPTRQLILKDKKFNG
jgi:hypothetical protein